MAAVSYVAFHFCFSGRINSCDRKQSNLWWLRWQSGFRMPSDGRHNCKRCLDIHCQGGHSRTELPAGRPYRAHRCQNELPSSRRLQIVGKQRALSDCQGKDSRLFCFYWHRIVFSSGTNLSFARVVSTISILTSDCFYRDSPWLESGSWRTRMAILTFVSLFRSKSWVKTRITTM